MGATDHQYIRTIKRIAARQKIPGLSDYMSAVKTDTYMARVLGPVVLSCIARPKIQKDAEAYALFTIEDVVSLLQHTHRPRLPTLKILEDYVGRKILIASEGLETVGILPNHLLDRFKEQDVMDNIRFRLRLPDPPSLHVDEKAAEEAEVASRIVFTFLRAESTSHTVLAVTTLRYNSCDTLFFSCHSYPEQQIKPVEQRLTSVFKHIFMKTGVCTRSVTAIFPKPARKRYIGTDVEKSAYRACRLALAFVKEIQHGEREAKKSRQQSTQSEKEAQEGASSLKRTGLAWGHLMCSTGSPDLSLVSLEGLEEPVKKDGNTEEGDRIAERHEDFVNQEQNLDEPNALLSEVLMSEIEDTDEDNDSETESLVSSLMGELINKDSMHNVDATEIETNDSPDYDTLSGFDDFSADEVEARVMKLLTPEQIKNSRLTSDLVLHSPHSNHANRMQCTGR